jgi:hypothetical protein
MDVRVKTAYIGNVESRIHVHRGAPVLIVFKYLYFSYNRI